MKKLVPLCRECSAKLIDAGIDLDAKPEPSITIKELEKICNKYASSKNVLTAGKRAARKESKK